MVAVIEVRVGGRTFRSVQSGLLDVQKRLSLSLDKAAVPVTRELLQSLRRVALEMVKLHSNPWRPGGSGSHLFRRSGGGLQSILNSVQARSSGKLGTVIGQIGAAFPMSVHEHGATVTARRSQFLTIPLPAALDGRGIPLRARARDWDNTFVARSRRGNLIIFQKQGDGIVPLYVLKRSVTIPPRLRLGATLDKIGLPFFQARAIDAIEREIGRAFS